MRIDTSGNVGIGTTSAGARLQINGSTADTSAYALITRNSGGTSLFSVRNDGRVDIPAGNVNVTGDITLTGNVFTDEGFYGDRVWNEDNGNLRFATNNTERMRIDSSGNLMVGKTSIGSQNHGGEIRATGQVVSVVDGNWAGLFNRETSDGELIRLKKDDVTVGVIGTQNWGIGTSSPSSPLHVKYTSNGDCVILEGTESGPSASPDLVLYRNSSSPADGDQIGNIFFRGKDDGGNDANYALILGAIKDASDGTEDGNLFFRTVSAGSLANRLSIVSDLVGIGTDDPIYDLQVGSYGTDSDSTLALASTTSGTGSIRFGDGTSGFEANAGKINYDHSSNSMQFFTNGGVERARIDSSGNLLVGKTSSTFSATGTQLASDGSIVATRSGNPVLTLGRLASNGEIQRFFQASTQVGNISVTGSATTYNTSSDARLKDITGSARGLEVINELNPVAYDWKADGKSDEGLIAQEVKELVPNAVSETEEGYYQMDYSKLVTPLIKAVQELTAKVENLEAQLANK